MTVTTVASVAPPIAIRALYAKAIAAAAEADSAEAEAGTTARWRQADAYVALVEAGETQMAIAKRCGVPQSSVSVYINCVRNYRVPDNRPLFWHAYREVTGEGLSTRELLEQSENNEWFTPLRYLESARAVMGGIDLDPASSEAANLIVGADRIYTLETNGLVQEWSGRIWLNPPYGGLVAKFAVRLREQFEAGRIQAGILLVNSHPTETKWFQAMLRRYPVCFTDHRIDFTNDDPEDPGGGSTHGSAFVYLGDAVALFAAEFIGYGAVVGPV